jgi:hypothetical protein
MSGLWPRTCGLFAWAIVKDTGDAAAATIGGDHNGASGITDCRTGSDLVVAETLRG